MGTQDRREWLSWRQQGIGGSDAAAIVGLDPFKSAMSVWLSKVTALDTDEPDQDGPMRWGKLLEPVVIDEFEDRSHLVVTDRQSRVVHNEIPYMRATLDGIVRDSAIEETDPHTRNRVYRPLGIYEGKTASRGSDAWRDGVPDHVQVQVQHQLAVTGLPTGWVAALLLSPTPRLEVFTVDRDEAAIQVLLEAENAFWQLVLERRPPATDGSEATSEALRRAYAEPAGGRVELTKDQAGALRVYATARLLEDDAKRERLRAEQLLQAAMGDNEIATVDGNEVVTWKAYEQKRIDLDALRLKHPKIAAEHTNVVVGRRFSVKSKFMKEAE